MARSKVPEEWRGHLTAARRAHFESVGEASVQFDVSNHNYGEQEKQFAALAWLAEQRDARRRVETFRFHIVFWVVLATLLATLWAAAVTKGWM